LPLLRT